MGRMVDGERGIKGDGETGRWGDGETEKGSALHCRVATKGI